MLLKDYVFIDVLHYPEPFPFCLCDFLFRPFGLERGSKLSLRAHELKIYEMQMTGSFVFRGSGCFSFSVGEVSHSLLQSWQSAGSIKKKKKKKPGIITDTNANLPS